MIQVCDRGVGKMVVAKMFKKIYASHVGTNKETGRQMLEGETSDPCASRHVDRTDQSGRFWLGVLTKTGLGTLVEQGKQIVEVDGERFHLKTNAPMLPYSTQKKLILRGTLLSTGDAKF